MMEEVVIIKDLLEKEIGFPLAIVPTLDDLKSKLAAYINYLIINDFDKLIFILYRIDVNENKIKLLLQNATSSNAADTIAQAIMDRQVEKIKSRKQFTPIIKEFTTEEEW